ncbi:hypothetical protein Anas_06379 [Armadillidium nasatum]|uniref:Uncharacterized protein n=1 Tax=Armadillidium nasatum TaxID=96803 RepID=A0A5N5SVY8_9CRUS|nr:hypothetical protein Anas_06379 [Armadillidium nasatum]
MSRITEEEIKEGKEFMRMKDFWLVYNDIDNCDLLQAILDKYYNECPNTYSAEILDHQNSSRLVIRCNVCNGKQLSSYDPFISHNSGKNHKKSVAKRQDSNECTMIDLPVLEFKKLGDIENPFERGTLEFELFETVHDIIGYQFLYREIKNTGEFITCQLCAKYDDKYKCMKTSSALRHMKSKYHQNNYLRTKFGIQNSTLENERSRQDYIADVIQLEGKLLHKILTIDATDPNEEPPSSSKEGKDLDLKSENVAEASSTKELIKDPDIPETPEQFLEVIHGHLQHLNKNKGDDGVMKNLQKDPEALDLLVSTANVLAQKIYMFSENYEPVFKPANYLKDVIISSYLLWKNKENENYQKEKKTKEEIIIPKA